MAKLMTTQLDDLGPGRHTVARGLHLWVQKSGSRSWILRLPVDGRRNDFGLGGYPAVSMEEAKELAVAKRAALVPAVVHVAPVVQVAPAGPDITLKAVERLTDRILEVKEELKVDIAKLNDRLDMVDSRLDKVDSRLGSIESKLDLVVSLMQRWGAVE